MPRTRYDILKPGGGFEAHWWDPINAPLLDAAGNVTAIIHHVTRVTELHLAEEAERKHRERQAFLLKLSDALRPLADPLAILQDLSARLIAEGDIQTIYEAVLTAAIDITRADAGTVQMMDDDAQELVVLATRGFSQPTQEYFHRVDASSTTSCSVALRSGQRSFVDFDPASPELPIRLHVGDGILSAQSSPLVSRAGKAIGMVSTHWREHGHRPSERELRFLDLLARQAADIIERQRAGQALRGSKTRSPSGGPATKPSSRRRRG